MDGTWRTGMGARWHWGRPGIVWSTCIALLMAIFTYAGAEEPASDARPPRDLEEWSPQAFFGKEFQGGRLQVEAVKPVTNDYDVVAVSAYGEYPEEGEDHTHCDVCIVKRGQRVPYLDLGQFEGLDDFGPFYTLDVAQNHLVFGVFAGVVIHHFEEYLFDLKKPRLIASYPEGTRIRGVARSGSEFLILTNDGVNKRILRVLDDADAFLEIVYTFEDVPADWDPEMRQGPEGPEIGDDKRMYCLQNGAWTRVEGDLLSAEDRAARNRLSVLSGDVAPYDKVSGPPVYRTENGDGAYWIIRGSEHGGVAGYEGKRLRFFPLPVPDQLTFLDRRPMDVERSGCRFSNAIGASQVREETLLFGIQFKETRESAREGEEELSGLGGWGDFNFLTHQYEMHYLPVLAQRAVTALSSETDALWFGTICVDWNYGQKSGLLRLDAAGNASEFLHIPEVLSALYRCGDAIIAVGTHSVFQVVDGKISRAEFRHEEDGALRIKFSPLKPLQPWY